MGIDLALHPHFTESSYDPRERVNVRPGYTDVRPFDWLTYTRIPTCRDYEMHARVRAIPSTPVAAAMIYGDEGCREWTTDKYGTPLCHVPAGALADAMDVPEAGTLTRAAVAYLRAISPTCRVLLWWH